MTADVQAGLAGVAVAWSLARPPAWLPIPLHRALRGLVWGTCLVMLARAVVGLIGSAAVLAEESPRPALMWNLLVYSPYFLLWALLWAALARHTTPALTTRASPRRHVVDR